MDLKRFVKDYVYDDGKPEKADTPSTPITTATGIPGIPGLPGLTSRPTTATVSPVGNESDVVEYVKSLRALFVGLPTTAILKEFEVSMASLSSFIPEEGNRVRAVLQQLQDKGICDFGKLKTAFQDRLALLAKESKTFATDCTSHHKEIEAAEKVITDKQAEVERLIKQAAEMKSKLLAAETSFRSAVSSLENDVNDWVGKLSLYEPKAATKT